MLWMHLAEEFPNHEHEKPTYWNRILNEDSSTNTFIFSMKMGLRGLPSSSAFETIAKSLRENIKYKKSLNQIYEEELIALYQIAAIASFSELDFKHGQLPALVLMFRIPGSILFNLSVSYNDLGFEKLSMLINEDKKWFIEAWGKPKSHSTFKELYSHVWDKYALIVEYEGTNNLQELLKGNYGE